MKFKYINYKNVMVMKKLFSFEEYIKLLEYNVFEALTTKEVDDESIIKKADKTSPTKDVKKTKDDKTEEESIDKTLIPKDKQIKALAKELYFAQYEVFKIQDETDKAIIAMTKADAEDPTIAKFTATVPVMIANATQRVASIEKQMLSIGAGNVSLTNLANTLSAESKNLAFKKAIEEFGEKVKKYIDAAEKTIKDKEKESSDSKEKSEEE